MRIIKKFLSFLVKKWFEFIPYEVLVRAYEKHKNKKYKFIDIYEEVYYKRFFKESLLIKDFDKSLQKVMDNNNYCLINEGNWEYKVINFCFIREMIANIIWCLENGYKPLINIFPKNGNYKSHSNLWEKMYKQPFDGVIENDKAQYMVCPIKVHCIIPKIQDAFDADKVDFWNRIFREFVVFNDDCQKYVDDEVVQILQGKKVVGCLIRGTDYTKLKPKGHPIQPSVAELICKIKDVMETNDLDYVYLATEEKKFADEIKDKFPGVVLENKRKYFDEVYNSNELEMVSQVSFDREDDDFLKILEYMSSVNLLSKCDSLVTGLCGGSEAAIYFNGNQYTTKYIFDKGVY